MELDAKQKREMVRWAKRALHGLDESTVFVGILDDHPLDAARIEFTLQLGHSLLTDKMIIIPAPFGVEIPAKLAKVADRIVRYDPARVESLQDAMTVALTELGVNRQ